MSRSSERRITVVLADDQDAIVDALTRLLAEQPDIEVLGAGRNAEEALKLCIEHEPDVAVLDVRMPQGGGPVAAMEIRSRGLRTRVVALFGLRRQRDPRSHDGLRRGLVRAEGSARERTPDGDPRGGGIVPGGERRELGLVAGDPGADRRAGPRCRGDLEAPARPFRPFPHRRDAEVPGDDLARVVHSDAVVGHGEPDAALALEHAHGDVPRGRRVCGSSSAPPP